ncbi:NADP-dependent oxidoreductase domain-containing protein [Fomitopsis serialis]|uniref:NADP-dependent oxidoreductase domain-containing protein n=1 Tax=Fomitopsis serialis TaxID=139415 RepID=UPI0020086FC7|nr:NADP-dependent oxidoreductase domain-containing protein [Neoantrodia serialis]KAH9919322.1 NADP-dependent oxidoreductase domain-containing protein [Neoantrodia serialis]
MSSNQGSKSPVLYQPLVLVTDDGVVSTGHAGHEQKTMRRNVLSPVKSLLGFLVGSYIALYLLCRFQLLQLDAVCSGHTFGFQCHRPVDAKVSTLPTHYALPSGDKIPSVALGVWQAAQGEVGAAVKVALKAGYRHIDGAWRYENEAEVGQAIKESGVAREDIWLTSKLWNWFHAPEDVEPALTRRSAICRPTISISTSSIGYDGLDWRAPIALKKDTYELDEALTADPYPTWKKLEEMVEKGKVRNIGISNFNIPRIKNLTANPLKYKPAVNQVELNYWNPQPELLKWCQEHDLLLEAYSPLGSNKQVKETLQLPEVQEIANELNITPAQAIISWHVQRGTVVLPKSVTPSRVKENLQVFALPKISFKVGGGSDVASASAISIPPSVQPPFDIFDDYPYDK